MNIWKGVSDQSIIPVNSPLGILWPSLSESRNLTKKDIESYTMKIDHPGGYKIEDMICVHLTESDDMILIDLWVTYFNSMLKRDRIVQPLKKIEVKKLMGMKKSGFNVYMVKSKRQKRVFVASRQYNGDNVHFLIRFEIENFILYLDSESSIVGTEKGVKRKHKMFKKRQEKLNQLNESDLDKYWNKWENKGSRTRELGQPIMKCVDLEKPVLKQWRKTRSMDQPTKRMRIDDDCYVDTDLNDEIDEMETYQELRELKWKNRNRNKHEPILDYDY